MILIEAGTGPTHPTGPAGPGPGGPAGPTPGGPPPPKATGPTAPDPQGPPPPPPGPPTASFPYPDPPGGPTPNPGPHPPPPKHLVDHGWKLEVWSRDAHLLARAAVNNAGLWDIQLRPGGPVFISDREEAETALRAVAVSAS